MSTEGNMPNADQFANAMALLELAAEQSAELYEAALRAQHNKSDERAQLHPVDVAMCIIPVHRNIEAALRLLGSALPAKACLREHAEEEALLGTNIARFPKESRTNEQRKRGSP